jgi:hypothetical protein
MLWGDEKLNLCLEGRVLSHTKLCRYISDHSRFLNNYYRRASLKRGTILDSEIGLNKGCFAVRVAKFILRCVRNIAPFSVSIFWIHLDCICWWWWCSDFCSGASKKVLGQRFKDWSYGGSLKEEMNYNLTSKTVSVRPYFCIPCLLGNCFQLQFVVFMLFLYAVEHSCICICPFIILSCLSFFMREDFWGYFFLSVTNDRFWKVQFYGTKVWTFGMLNFGPYQWIVALLTTLIVQLSFAVGQVLYAWNKRGLIFGHSGSLNACFNSWHSNFYIS